jgi:hypothetical protein
MSTRQKLIEEIEKFRKAFKMPMGQFGEEAIGDRALVTRLRAGRDVTTATADRIRAYMERKRAERKNPKEALDRATPAAA